MKAITFTTRNVTAGQGNTTGDMVLRTVGDVTVTLEPMTRSEVAEWEYIADGLNTRGWDEKQFRLTVRGWKVIHGGQVVGILLQGAGTRVHVEWYDAINGDFFPAAWTRNLRHGAAAIINARQRAGQGLPADAQPEPVKAPQPVRPTVLRDGTQVDYHGSLEHLRGARFWVMECECFECDRYQLMEATSRGGWVTAALHVRPASVTAVEGAVNILSRLAASAA